MKAENNRENNRNNIPDHDPSKAMDSRKEVEQSKDPKTDQDFPGYPHYPAKEDIMDQSSETDRVDLDVENIPSNRNVTGLSQRFRENQDAGSETGGEDAISLSGAEEEEVGKPHNVSNEDLGREEKDPGTQPGDEGSDRGRH